MLKKTTNSYISFGFCWVCLILLMSSLQELLYKTELSLYHYEGDVMKWNFMTMIRVLTKQSI